MRKYKERKGKEREGNGIEEKGGDGKGREGTGREEKEGKKGMDNILHTPIILLRMTVL